MRSRLRVQLLPRSILRQVPDLATRGFSETLLVVAYVVDEADRMRHVTRPMLAQWGVDEAAQQTAVEGPALANLEAASKDAAFGLALADGAPVLVMAQARDDDDAARLMLPRYRDDIRRAPKADGITVAVPARGLLMAWPTDSKVRVRRAAEVRTQLRTKPCGRSDALFRVDGTGLRPFTTAECADHGR